jgi:mannose/fructose/N-acetylgalactosamine-specific phosphotransferase system component IID
MSKELTAEEKKDLKRVWRRQFLVMASINSIKGMAAGVTYVMLPFLERWYKDDKDGLIEALQRNNEYINTNGTAGSFLWGLLFSLEKQKAENGTVDGQMISNIKASLMGPLAAIGDPLFYLTTLTVADGIAIGFMSEGNPIGLLLFLLIFQGVNMGVRWPLIKAGYTMGSDFLKKLFDNGMVKSVTNAASVMGLMMIGALSTSLIKPTVTLTFTMSGTNLAVQDILDSILPKGLCLAALFICMYLLKEKKVSVIRLVLYIILFSMVVSFLGIM